VLAGEIASSILIPAVCDVAKKYKSPLTGKPAIVVAAGGIRDGRSLAASLMQGAAGVWVGTRFVASVEAGCSEMHKREILSSDFADTVRTLVLSGRPMRVKANDYIKAWEKRPEKILELTEAGVVPYIKDMEGGVEEADRPFMMGQVAAVINEIKPASEIVEDMVNEATAMLSLGSRYLTGSTNLAKL
jgi:NAD(P)H-dependent flavin oxidoreductase YrpB (nitropropane dioxygenase family)